MVEARPSQLSVYNLEIDDPLFFAFITSNEACDLLRRIEEEYHLRVRFEQKIVILEGYGRINVDEIKNTLMEAWKEDDFKRAIEVSELTNSSDFQLYFKVSPAESALMQVNSKKLLRCPDLIAFKADASGNVCLFGKNSSASEVFEMVSEVVYQAATCGNILCNNRACFDGPCILSMRFPQKMVENIFSTENAAIVELGRTCHFFLEKDDSLGELDHRLGISVNIFTKCFEDALKVKDAVCAQVVLLNGTKRKLFGDIKLQCGAFTLSFSADPNAALNKSSFKVVLSAMEIQLIFWVHERDAPRIIGSHGITKKRIQECSKCKVLLHTETKRNGFFPVEIIGPNVQKCVETRHRIESFLMQPPPVVSGKDQQWNLSIVDDRFQSVESYDVSGLSLQHQYLYAHDPVLSAHQSFNRSLTSNNSCTQSFLNTYGNNDQATKALTNSKVKLQLVRPSPGIVGSEGLCD